MCSQIDDPTTYDEPLEDTVDWKRLRQIRIEREQHATADERKYGIPQRPGYIERHYDQLMAVQARRGWQFDPDERA